jgi:hypothetical protein
MPYDLRKAFGERDQWSIYLLWDNFRNKTVAENARGELLK